MDVIVIGQEKEPYRTTVEDFVLNDLPPRKVSQQRHLIGTTESYLQSHGLVPFGTYAHKTRMLITLEYASKVGALAQGARVMADHSEKCPECGSPLRALWSGVVCSNGECQYWFCY